MKRVFVLIFILAVFVSAFFLLRENPAALILPEWVEEHNNNVLNSILEEPSLTVFISEDTHFFPEGRATVEIFSSNPYAEIFFTTDGSTPTRDSEIYTEPIELRSRNDAVILRAIATYADETTAPLTHTFFFRRDIYERFHENMLVFSLATSDDYLYCFYNGIFVAGAMREEYLSENPGTHITPLVPANFQLRGMESERPMHVEIFYPDGRRILAQDAGGRVFGSWSRAETVTSVRLIARREYSPHAGRFHYEFFPGDAMRDGFNTPISAYNTLILRNGGNDRNHGIIRNELGSLLLRRAGVYDVTPVRAAAMFINGRYYGYVWLQTRFDGHYLQEIFGTPTRDFDIVGRGEWWFRNATEEQEEALTYKNMFAFEDLTCDETFARLEELVCVDNLLFFYAFQIFLANADWPHNNLRRWRYAGEPFAGMAPELDGRWRYAYFDLDQTFGLFGQNYRRNTFQLVLERDNEAGQLIRAILLRPEMAERFTMMLCDIAANVVNEEIVREIMDSLFADIENEVTHTIEAGELIAEWTSWYSIGRYKDATLEFAELRHTFIFYRLGRFFEFDPEEMFDVTVTGGEAIIGTQRGTASRYFLHLTVPVTPVLPENTAFDHWLINDQRIYNERVYIDASMTQNGTITLELITRPDYPPLIILDAFFTPQGSGIILQNNSDETIQTGNYFLSNRRHQLDRFRLPRATLTPGATLELAGENSRIPGDVFRVQLNFNIREGRRVFLSDENGEILSAFMPAMQG